MDIVNHCLIARALMYLMVPETRDGTPLILNPNDEFTMKKAFAEFVKPTVARWSDSRLHTLKVSFAYFIHQPEILDFNVLATVQDLPLNDDPSDIQAFFRWLYEVLFPDDPISEVDVSRVREDNDIMKTNFAREDFRLGP